MHNKSSDVSIAAEVMDDNDCRALLRRTPSSDTFISKAGGHFWELRADDSKELHMKGCKLHRFTASEAQQCLKTKHILMAGDSLTRYQYLSLVYLLHHGRYPDRFGRSANCKHIDEKGNPTCTPKGESNIVMEGDFNNVGQQGLSGWPWYHAQVGGWNDGGEFDGRMECNCARGGRVCKNGSKTLPIGECGVENLLYYHENDDIVMSMVTETGWFDKPRPIVGFNWTHCGRSGSCRHTANKTLEAIDRAYRKRDYDWSQQFPDAVRPNGMLSKELPPVDISLYNRGIWNKLPVKGALELMPLLSNFTRERCFYKTTTGCGRTPPRLKHEKENLHDIVLESGCEWYDIGELTTDFSGLNNSLPDYKNHFWDSVHYQPWVYEELNNFLLHILCYDR